MDEPESAGTIRAAREETIAKAEKTFEEALNKVLPVTKSIVEKLRSFGNEPDEIEICFGVKLNTIAGAVIASASAEANFDVTVRWTGKKKKQRLNLDTTIHMPRYHMHSPIHLVEGGLAGPW